MEYNTERNPLLIKEYGRNVQRLIDHISTIEDRDKRTGSAYTLIELMKQLNPITSKENLDVNQRLWDHLFIMSDFKLDVDSPYPMPDRSILTNKPQQMGYRTTEVKYKHYGRNVELLVEKALALEDEEAKTSAFIQIGRLMKTFYLSWNKENVNNDSVIEHLEKLAKTSTGLRELVSSFPDLLDSETPVRDIKQDSKAKVGLMGSSISSNSHKGKRKPSAKPPKRKR